MRHVGLLRRPRQPSWAEAWPTGKPTVRGRDERITLVDFQVEARLVRIEAEQHEADAADQHATVDEYWLAVAGQCPRGDGRDPDDGVHRRRNTPPIVVGEHVRADEVGRVELFGQLVFVFVVHDLDSHLSGHASRNLCHETDSASGSTRASATEVMKLESAVQRGITCT